MHDVMTLSLRHFCCDWLVVIMSSRIRLFDYKNFSSSMSTVMEHIRYIVRLIVNDTNVQKTDGIRCDGC